MALMKKTGGLHKIITKSEIRNNSALRLTWKYMLTNIYICFHLAAVEAKPVFPNCKGAGIGIEYFKVVLLIFKF